MSEKQPVNLTKTFNDNVAQMLNGLQKLRQEFGHQMDVIVEAGTSNVAGDFRIVAFTNIRAAANDAGQLGFLISEKTGIQGFSVNYAAGENAYAELSFNPATPEALLQKAKSLAKANGFVPKH